MVNTTAVRHSWTLLSPDARLALAPTVTYAELLAEAPTALWRRLGLFVLVLAVAIPIMALQRVTIALVATTAIAWSFVLAIQLIVGSVLIASVRSRPTGFMRALGLWFAGYLPYGLWLLAVAALMSNMTGSVELVIVLAIVPSLWTAAIVSAFCRVVLGCSRAGARWRAAIHLLSVWTIGLEYVAVSAGGWFQITASLNGFFE
jgi:hypothetical protein